MPKLRVLSWEPYIRIDYLCTSAEVAKSIQSASILPMIKHSDHCPIELALKNK
jgi:exonuclease III